MKAIKILSLTALVIGIQAAHGAAKCPFITKGKDTGLTSSSGIPDKYKPCLDQAAAQNTKKELPVKTGQTGR